MRARTLILVLAGLLLLGSVASAAEPIVIGEINQLTGALTRQGQSVHPGITLAVGEGYARGGTLAGDPLRSRLAALDLLPLGPVKFDDKGDPPFYERAFVQIQNGRDVVAYPAERATGPASPS